MSQSRRWCFTSFDLSKQRADIWDPEVMKYLIIGLETCPDTERKHYQGFVIFTEPKRLAACKRILPTAHWEVTKHDSEKNVAYCSKEGDVETFGELHRADARKRTLEDALEECTSVAQFIERYPHIYARSPKGICDVYAHRERAARVPFEPVEVIWIYGPTGTNKSRRAFEDGATPVVYANGFFSDWGDAKTLVLDDFRGEVPYAKLLTFLDGYRNAVVNIKGGQKRVNVNKIYITSPNAPGEVYRQQVTKDDSIEQLTRRITHLVCTGQRPTLVRETAYVLED